MEREDMEWTDTWWEQANDKASPRILLVGDSITRGYHSFLQQIFGSRAHIDRYTTSRFAADHFFIRESELYLSEYKYTAMHINHGLHGKTFSKAEYDDALERFIEMALKYCKNIAIATSTTVASVEWMEQIRQRNITVASLAERYRLKLNDLYTVTKDRLDIKLNDGIHFNEEDSRLLAEHVADALTPFIK